MKVLIFGATGMVGQGVLRECLADPQVELVRSVSRTSLGLQNPKLRETLRSDLSQYAGIEAELQGFDACFFSLGVSSAGMKEADYTRITYDLTLAAAETLCSPNPGMTFIYVSGAGTDSTEKGRIMWARVKGRTENALLRLPFKAAYMFRPGVIQPVHGVKSRVAWYRVLYALTKPVLPLLRRVFPNSILTTEEIGRAMLLVAGYGCDKKILEAADIRAVLHSPKTG